MLDYRHKYALLKLPFHAIPTGAAFHVDMLAFSEPVLDLHCREELSPSCVEGALAHNTAYDLKGKTPSASTGMGSGHAEEAVPPREGKQPEPSEHGQCLGDRGNFEAAEWKEADHCQAQAGECGANAAA